MKVSGEEEGEMKVKLVTLNLQGRFKVKMEIGLQQMCSKVSIEDEPYI